MRESYKMGIPFTYETKLVNLENDWSFWQTASIFIEWK